MPAGSQAPTSAARARAPALTSSQSPPSQGRPQQQGGPWLPTEGPTSLHGERRRVAFRDEADSFDVAHTAPAAVAATATAPKTEPEPEPSLASGACAVPERKSNASILLPQAKPHCAARLAPEQELATHAHPAATKQRTGARPQSADSLILIGRGGGRLAAEARTSAPQVKRRVRRLLLEDPARSVSGRSSRVRIWELNNPLELEIDVTEQDSRRLHEVVLPWADVEAMYSSSYNELLLEDNRFELARDLIHSLLLVDYPLGPESQVETRLQIDLIPASVTGVGAFTNRYVQMLRGCDPVSASALTSLQIVQMDTRTGAFKTMEALTSPRRTPRHAATATAAITQSASQHCI